MKKIAFFILMTQMAFANTPPRNFTKYLEAFDCDACGCSASGGGMGFSSMINGNFVGVRYFHQSYSSLDGIFNNSPWVDENFNTVQAWARIPVAKNLQVSALVPYHFHNRRLATGEQSIDGLGDITVLGLYTLYQTKNDSVPFRHVLQMGGGIKAPTGKYDSANNGSVNPSFQVGTGSWDYLLAAEYIITRNNLGLNAMVNYTFKTENSEKYHFGDQFNYAATLFYMAGGDKLTVVPQAGIAGELYAANKQYGEDLPDTKGDILFGKLGVEAGLGKFSVGVAGMLPISQNLTGGRVEANYRWSVNLNYSL
ncbi:transporter [Flavobacterium sp. MFBS3-15]|uniref:transporter n=1 Tax=Flavobacterium sp. MFBS3-15 TaxID=2989816 RepID=UPI0022357F90|nr:transporter [Flavobacterium sp. MFBS3-15]MCW4467377.1 transporter [Flavobacterium sp. MFBS3-15]